jgi:hypothetical protein
VSGTDPEETMPFTHRPYGSDEATDPTTSPDGTSVQPSGADYVSPSAPPPSMASAPYGAPMPGQPAPAGWGAAYHGQQHPGASRARTLGIVALVSAAVAFFCCITFPGVFCAPFAWAIGRKAQREIDASPGVYNNRGEAQAGVVMGIIGTIISIVFVAATVVIVIALASANWTLV